MHPPSPEFHSRKPHSFIYYVGFRSPPSPLPNIDQHKVARVNDEIVLIAVSAELFCFFKKKEKNRN
jgi:hypothetical protein